MSNPILIVTDAGYGTTPDAPEAKFKVNDVVRVKGHSAKGLAAIAVVVPAGFPAEYALADARAERRPLTITRPLRVVSYIVGFMDDERPYLFPERKLIATAEPPANIGWTDRQEAQA